ncbi:dimethylallyl tryptophan synthase FgaPT2 [Penicillium angulare]|uniref:dimethylallyl tryptophan synthase FgaPT2 n=1 Tax=Penicillium angulare TaxID=116970 RepID=UPI0025413158|nr:dimethylallyl tryptophan synthase FgaPT2 [Penicillium angulare]KAJ5263964.1 dimethylallyl tryptophan synthase FgaPT2 [Penicillium angulare]
MANASHAEVYQSLSAAWSFSDENEKLWWHSTAPMFAHMLQSAEYMQQSQRQHLEIYKRVVIPMLGAYPVEDRPRWMSILTRYGTPFELSLNCSKNIVSYTYEPISLMTGTAQDPYNTNAIWEALHHLAVYQPGINLEWFSYFKKALTLTSEESAFLLKNNSLVGDQIKTQNKLSLQLDKDDDFTLKVYIYPALKSLVTKRSTQDLIFGAAHNLTKLYPTVTISTPLKVLEEYLKSRAPNSTVKPCFLSYDLVEPPKSRIKIYLLEEQVTLTTLEDLWTLGGRRNDNSTVEGLKVLQELWNLINLTSKFCTYPVGYLSLSDTVNEQLPLLAGYTIHPDDPYPEPEIYFQTFGHRDQKLAKGLMTFFQQQGWTRIAKSYGRDLRAW